MAEISGSDRAKFAGEKLWGALKWIAISGTVTYFLTGLLELVSELEIPRIATLGIYLIINTAIFGVAKYIEGENGKENGEE